LELCELAQDFQKEPGQGHHEAEGPIRNMSLVSAGFPEPMEEA
jgi:hypothetical protein